MNRVSARSLVVGSSTGADLVRPTHVDATAAGPHP